jgi:hypothetical protein
MVDIKLAIANFAGAHPFNTSVRDVETDTIVVSTTVDYDSTDF